MQFAFRTAGQILFGRGEALRAAEMAAGLGRCVFLVTGATSLEKSGRLEALTDRLSRAAGGYVRFRVSGEPDVTVVDEAAQAARAAGCDVVVGCGGGSALDVAKAVASLVTNGGNTLAYLEDVGPSGGQPIRLPSLPTVLMPTTAGTGAEVTRNAVLRVPELSVKRSMRSDLLLPRIAAVDPDLMEHAPLSVAAAAGFDALTHLVEAFVSRAAQPLTDALAVQGIPRALRGLAALADGNATPATWEDLALVALYGGMAVANAGLGAAHGLVAPLGGLLGVPHGLGCAALLPSVMLANVEALEHLPAADGRERQDASRARYRELAHLVASSGVSELAPSVDNAARTLAELRARLGLPSMVQLALPDARLGEILAQCRGGSMKANPVVLPDDTLARILRGGYEPLA